MLTLASASLSMLSDDPRGAIALQASERLKAGDSDLALEHLGRLFEPAMASNKAYTDIPEGQRGRTFVEDLTGRGQTARAALAGSGNDWAGRLTIGTIPVSCVAWWAGAEDPMAAGAVAWLFITTVHALLTIATNFVVPEEEGGGRKE